MIPNKPYRWFWVTALFYLFLRWQYGGKEVDIQFHDLYIVVELAPILLTLGMAHLIYGITYWLLSERASLQPTVATHLWLSILITLGVVVYLRILDPIVATICYQPEATLRFWETSRRVTFIILLILALANFLLLLWNIFLSIKNVAPDPVSSRIKMNQPIDQHLQTDIPPAKKRDE